MIDALKQQAKDFWTEITERVDWPAKDKVWASTWTVVLTAAFAGFFLWAADWFLGKGFSFLFPRT